MTPSHNDTDRVRKGYVTLGILLLPIVLLAFVNGIMAFVRVFTHTLGAIFLILEIAIVGLAIGAVGFWLVQRDRRAGYDRMQATLEQLLLEGNPSLSLGDFADRVQLPIPMARSFLDMAMHEREGNCYLDDGGELIYQFTSKPDDRKSVTTVDVEAISTEEIDAAAAALFSSQSDRKSPIAQADRPQETQPQSKPEQPIDSDGDFLREDKLKPAEDLSTNSLKKPLIQAELARRLSLSSSTLSYRKLKPDFSQWVRQKDPEGIAWRYSPESKRFYPE